MTALCADPLEGEAKRLAETAPREEGAALLRMTGEEGRGKEEAGPSPIRALRVWAQDDNERQRSQATHESKRPAELAALQHDGAA